MQKILLIQLKQIGDVLLSTSLFKNIKKNFPDSQVDILIYEHCKGVVEGNPYVDNIISITSDERKNFFKLLKKLEKLKKEKYDYSIDLLTDIRSGIITFFVNADKRIAAKKNKFRNKIFYNVRVENNLQNVIEYRNHLLTAIKQDIIFDNEVKIFLTEDEIKNLKIKMIEGGVDFSKPIAAFGINSRREYKIWKLEYFVEVIDYLVEKYDMQIILYNNKAERDYALKAKSKIKNKKNIFTDIETKNIRELVALLKNCDIFIGNEGGPRHMAESVETSTFSIGYITHDKESWILERNNWGVKNRMVQLDDFLNITDCEYGEIKKRVKRNTKLELEEFYKITPEFIIKNIEEIIFDLKAKNMFRGTIEWKK